VAAALISKKSGENDHHIVDRGKKKCMTVFIMESFPSIISFSEKSNGKLCNRVAGEEGGRAVSCLRRKGKNLFHLCSNKKGCATHRKGNQERQRSQGDL